MTTINERIENEGRLQDTIVARGRAMTTGAAAYGARSFRLRPMKPAAYLLKTSRPESNQINRHMVYRNQRLLNEVKLAVLGPSPRRAKRYRRTSRRENDAERRETLLSGTFADFDVRGCAWPITSPVKPCTSAMRLVDTKIPLYAIGASPEDADTCCRPIPAKGS